MEVVVNDLIASIRQADAGVWGEDTSRDNADIYPQRQNCARHRSG